MLLQDKVVVVTGVGPGLGRSMALAAADDGARVVCVARTAAFVEEVADEINGRGGEALAVPGDITSAEDCARVASETDARFGRLDGLVNSAFSAGPIALFEHADLDAWRQVFEVNVFGTLSMIRACLPLLSRDGGGAVVNVNTMSATRPMKMQGAYGGSRSSSAHTACAVTPCTAGPCSGPTSPTPWTSGPSGGGRHAKSSRPRWRRTWPSAASLRTLRVPG
jgi:NAD(P)-dependent dehydrogenase (short-subunit alcohol dehydrogenase family)